MARHRPNEHLAELLTEANWSAGELARAVNALGTKHGVRLRYDRTSVAHWLNGSIPRPPVPDLVAQVLTRRIARTVTVAETGLVHSTPDESLRENVLTTADPVERLVTLCRTDIDPAQRAVLNRELITARPLPSRGWPATGNTGPPDPPPAEPALTDLSDDRLDHMAVVFATLTERYGGAHARSALATYLADDVAHLVAITHPGSDLPRRLIRGTAQLTHLLGAMTIDACLTNVGYLYYHSALGLAHRAGDRTSYAISLRAMSMSALHLDDVRHARQWSDQAVETAGPAAPPAVRSYLHAGRAVVHATDGRRRLALADLLTAERHHDTAPRNAGPFTHYPLTALHYQRALVLLALGDRPGALIALEASLNTRPAEHHTALVLLHALLAQTLLSAGELEAALPHCRQLFDHYPLTSSCRARKALTALRNALHPYHRHPQARETRAHAAYLIRRPSLR
ncbi:hypothetical protein GCM10010211_44230 [Streptomyces albospinus]|uniref:Regulatory protein n=1 Tax=Streptomyces albospinus TaxID=285515 RepID=A0ABQ2V9D0_9ACTN|nr:hypothetical protein [Streptomyces albospinus]GGU73445.1 hypothetical protein GCM10010211_44230 [Streptomyces albospinus]